MSVEKSLIKISGRNSIEQLVQNKTTTKDLREALEKTNKELEEHKDEVNELKSILTEHKSQLEKATSDIQESKDILKESNWFLKNMLTSYFIFIEFYKKIQEICMLQEWENDEWGVTNSLQSLLSEWFSRYLLIMLDF
jgi:cell division septum initiation protein DivIVA